MPGAKERIVVAIGLVGRPPEGRATARRRRPALPRPPQRLPARRRRPPRQPYFTRHAPSASSTAAWSITMRCRTCWRVRGRSLKAAPAFSARRLCRAWPRRHRVGRALAGLIAATEAGPYGTIATRRDAAGLSAALEAEAAAWDRGDRDATTSPATGVNGWIAASSRGSSPSCSAWTRRRSARRTRARSKPHVAHAGEVGRWRAEPAPRHVDQAPEAADDRRWRRAAPRASARGGTAAAPT